MPQEPPARTMGPDGPLRRIVKALARAWFFWTLSCQRRWLRWRGQERWALGGECRQCAECCEQPSLQVDVLTWYFHRTYRRLFLWWQRTVNGFELIALEKPRTFVFRCLHFDTLTRRCDSYHSRPGICRDYPRVLLQQPWPELLPGCGYRAIDKRAGSMLVALNTAGVSPEQQAELKQRLKLE